MSAPRRAAATALVLLGSCAAPDAGDAAIARAAGFLWRQQADDGGWHSEVYGVLRGGDALTGFVLATLLSVPETLHRRDAAAVARAVRFLRGRIDEGGAVGRDDLVPEYPNYASACALRAMLAVGGEADAVERLAAYLKGQQFRPETGWAEDHPAWGGFGMGGEVRRGGDDPGHVDLSMTRVVLEALAAAGETGEVLARARTFVRRCAAPGGGFSFSPVLPALNKAGRTAQGYLGYGSATADGILALRAAGLPPEAPEIRAAAALLVQGHGTDTVPGIPRTAPLRWAEALRFYYLAGSARVFAALGIAEAPPGRPWRPALVAALRAAQREDGSFANPAGSVKEDDPLIATPLALQALLAARIE